VVTADLSTSEPWPKGFVSEATATPDRKERTSSMRGGRAPFTRALPSRREEKLASPGRKRYPGSTSLMPPRPPPPVRVLKKMTTLSMMKLS